MPTNIQMHKSDNFICPQAGKSVSECKNNYG